MAAPAGTPCRRTGEQAGAGLQLCAVRPDGPDVAAQREVTADLDAESGGCRQVLERDGVAMTPGTSPGAEGVPPCTAGGAAGAEFSPL